MTLQWLLVAVAAALSAAYLAWQAWQAWSGKCGKGCGCSATSRRPVGLIAAEELTNRVKQRQTG